MPDGQTKGFESEINDGGIHHQDIAAAELGDHDDPEARAIASGWIRIREERGGFYAVELNADHVTVAALNALKTNPRTFHDAYYCDLHHDGENYPMSIERGSFEDLLLAMLFGINLTHRRKMLTPEQGSCINNG